MGDHQESVLLCGSNTLSCPLRHMHDYHGISTETNEMNKRSIHTNKSFFLSTDLVCRGARLLLRGEVHHVLLPDGRPRLPRVVVRVLGVLDELPGLRGDVLLVGAALDVVAPPRGHAP